MTLHIQSSGLFPVLLNARLVPAYFSSLLLRAGTFWVVLVTEAAAAAIGRGMFCPSIWRGTSFMTGVGVDSAWKSSPQAQNMEKQKVQVEGGKKYCLAKKKDVKKTTASTSCIICFCLWVIDGVDFGIISG